MENEVGFTIDFVESKDVINEWSDDVEDLLKDIEYNCSVMSVIHKKEYLSLIDQVKYYKIPILVLSSMNSIFSVGLNAYLEQNLVSTITCLISFICGVISSIELYLGLTKKIEAQILSYRSYYLLSIRINTVKKLDRKHRKDKGLDFLSSVTTEYENLFKDSEVSGITFKDKLLNIDKKPTLNKLLSFGTP